jgi:AraC-like DNA-binding protein
MEEKNLKIFPRSSLMKSIVDYYQLVEINEPVLLKTLPNGRLDAWINLSGSFYFYSKKTEKFIRAPRNGFFPFFSDGILIRITEKLICLSIKFFPHVIAYHNNLSKLLRLRQPVSLSKILETDIQGSIYKLKPQKDKVDLIVEVVEDYFTLLFSGRSEEKIWMEAVLKKIESDQMNSVTIKALAKEFNMTEKTLNRTFARQLGVNPKLFCKIVRFQKTVNEIKNDTIQNSKIQLNISLSNGYHDQSHFGKDSKKITGLSPKLLFQNLFSDFPDVIVSNKNV